jgi:anti-sigma regulatory factor (Ser/Thr protein kinase)
MLGFISSFADDHQFPEEFKNKLVIVGDELFSNIIRYGYENNGGSIFVRLLFDESQNEFAMTIIDKAKAFNQLEVNNKEVSGDVKELKVGGLGLIIVKKIMDEYAYDRINDKNILMLKKRF